MSDRTINITLNIDDVIAAGFGGGSSRRRTVLIMAQRAPRRQIIKDAIRDSGVEYDMVSHHDLTVADALSGRIAIIVFSHAEYETFDVAALAESMHAQCITATSGSLGNAIRIAEKTNHRRAQVLWCPSSPHLTDVIAATWAAHRADIESMDPAFMYKHYCLPIDVIGPGENPNPSDIEKALSNGVTPVVIGEVGNRRVLKVIRSVTTHTDTLDTCDVVVPDACAEAIKRDFEARYNRR